MDIINHHPGYLTTIHDKREHCAYGFDIESLHECSSEFIELHIYNLKKRMSDVKHDRVAWEAAATEMCRTLDLMLVRAKQLMTDDTLHFHKRNGANSVTLTQKQLNAIFYASKGLKNKQIAKELDVTVGSVSQILSRAYRILGVSSRYEAIVKCRDYSWF
jgi:DNA-binding NarL/FixJ family response regulator